MENNASDEILDEHEYLAIRTLDLTVMEVLIVAFSLGAIFYVEMPFIYDVFIVNDTESTSGDQTGLILMTLFTLAVLFPLAYVLLFGIRSRKRIKKGTLLEERYFSTLHQGSAYVGMFYVGLGGLMSFLYGFSDTRTIYTLLMLCAGIIVLNYTFKTEGYIKGSMKFK